MTTEENPEEEIKAQQPAQPEPAQPEPPEESEGADEEPAGEESADLKPEQQLQALVDGAKTARLSPADEERAVQLLKQTIPAGPKALPATVEAILTLSWSAGVKAVTEAWPETKPAGRTRLLSGLTKQDGDASRRIRLSLARGLHAQDPASALKLLTSVCEAMGGAQGGSSTKDRQIFANVMLGKARPWLMNVAMVEMKPAEALKLIIPALESCHQAPIFTQIWVLRWIIDAEKFDTLTQEHIASIGKSINRWQPRWRKELRKIIPKLPESLEAALGEDRPSTAAPAPSPAAAEAEPESESAPAEEVPAEDATVEEPEDEEEPRFAEPPPPRQPAPPPQHRGGREREREREREGGRESGRERGGPFDLNRTLRDIEGYVARLRSELQQAQAASRRREPAPERRRGPQAAVSSEEMEEMRRHNHQLEEQNDELRRRIEELLSDHEDRAATIEINDSLEQFKTYLGLKLKEDFADYNAISRESLNEVIRRHAHEILGHIFSVLQTEGVRFDREG